MKVRPAPTAAKQHTLGHINCPACEDLKRYIMRTGELGGQTFAEVWPLWWEQKQQEVGPKTRKCYSDYFRTLVLFFGNLKLEAIHIGHIVAYRRDRAGAGPSLINHEVNALKQLLEMAGLWEPIARRYKPLPLPRTGPGRRLESEELTWLFYVAQTKPRWRLAYLCSLVSSQTARGPSEILNLRLKDLDFSREIIHFVEGTKTPERVGGVPMTEHCMWALKELLLIAKEKGSFLPEHYLLPHRANAKGQSPDPKRPMGSYKRAWGALRTKAAEKFPALINVRRYDLRHTAATLMAENPEIDLPTLKEVLGHGPGSQLAIKNYFHAAHKRRKLAVSVLNDSIQPVKKQAESPVIPIEEYRKYRIQ